MRWWILASLFLCAVTCTFAQEHGGRGDRRGPARAEAPPPPLFFKETWKAAPGNVPVTQDFVTNPDLQLNTYGTGKTDFGVTSEGGVPHIWTGLCATSCALTLSHKDDFVDLTGKAKIRWYTKTSGFHEVRPVLKLADGTWLVGDHIDAHTFDYHESEFYLSEVHWLKLEMPKVLTRGTLLEKVDLSKVDAVGFADLTPGSGHGTGGYSDVAWIEVYGKPVKRDAADRSQ
ncbi:MAG TPA: hypothetical protein VJ732_01465 [Bryobacteraceae bacterium]|nr:hypothetical protein [Bryobacteraceae bacterium]